MVDLIDEPVDVSTHGVFNWILLLTIFSVITVIGNYIGYGHPLADSFIGMGILALITLIGVWLERKLPLDISSIIYISLIGIFIAFPGVPTSETVLYYVSKVELLSMGKSWDEFKALGWKAIIVTMLVIASTYFGSAIVAHIVLVMTGVPA